MSDKIPIVVILGCTGAGKSQLALELATKFNGEIISADAMQMYRGLDIITNKVTADEQKLVRHHMIDILHSSDEKTVVDFRDTALPIIEDLLNQGKIPFICGGTNYYIESLLWKVLVDEPGSEFSQNKRKYEEEDISVRKSKKSTVKDKEIISINDDPIGTNILMSDKDDGSISTEDLWQKLQEIDPDRGRLLHHNSRRKIWRSLQVWYKHGVTHSHILATQVSEGGTLGGAIRFPLNRICIIEVWSEQETLDDRCNRRVDKMISRGMVQELMDFHQSYNKNKSSVEEADYTRGIFQSIGFKEFHNYLILSDNDKQSDKGRQQFDKGVELLKIATRQYSRRQAKWMRRRFVQTDREVPPVYRVNSTIPELWQQNCYLPAETILKAYLNQTVPEVQPLERISRDTDIENTRTKFTCDVCDRVFMGKVQYDHHIEGKRHKQEVRRKANLEPPVIIRLVHYNSDNKLACAKMLKDTLEKPLADVVQLLEKIPCEIARMKPRSKAENIVKCLAKHQIILELQQWKPAMKT